MPKEYLKFTIRDQISDWIRDNKSSQAKLAKEIGISEATLNRFMSGKTDTLGIEQIVKLAELLVCSTDYLLGVTDIPRHQIIDAEELGLTENAATNIISRTVPIDVLNELLVDPHFIKALLLIDFYSSDYFSLFPWMFLFFAGGFFGRLAAQKKFPKAAYKNYVPFFSIMGKYSLIIYLVHQPVIFGICQGIEYIITNTGV